MPEITNSSRHEYIGRINKAMDFIESNLGRTLFLDEIARAAHFSPFHFHRIFSALTGETVNQYVKRIRIEKAASMLINNPEWPVTEIAIKCGFSSNPVFCRAFREWCGQSAGTFRKQYASTGFLSGPAISKNGQQRGNDSQLHPDGQHYLCAVSPLNESQMNAHIQVKEMPALDLVYCRHTGPFDQIGQAYEKLMRWAGPRGLMAAPDLKTVTVYHDDPKVTAIEKMRQSACITVQGDVKTSGEFGKMTVDAGKYAVGRFEIGVEGFSMAWDQMCNWFADSGYQPGEGYSYELYHNDIREHPEQKFILDICIPVIPL